MWCFFLLADSRESGYVNAISLAAIAYSVAKMCAIGEANSCSCSEETPSPPESSDVQFEIGCSDNVEFGIHFARNFLSKRLLGLGIREKVDLHNMKAGALVS